MMSNPTLYAQSVYNKRLDRNGYSALFNGVTMKKAYGTAVAMDRVLKEIERPYVAGRDRHVDRLVEHGFLVTPDEDGGRLASLRARVGSIDITNIVMLVDNRCNYRCSYCQIEENMTVAQQSHTMPTDVARRALDAFERNGSTGARKTISITGGEPLMNPGAVEYVIERAEAIPSCRTVVFTNGSLVTPELADYFARKNVLMLVSLDGPQDVHDAARVNTSGHGTFEASLRGYRLLEAAGCRTGISAVIGRHNADRIEAVLDFFIDLAPSSVGLNFGHYLIGKENPVQIEMKEFARILVRAYERLRTAGIFVENMSRFVEPFCQERPRLNECQAQGRGFTVDSRGRFGVCKSLLVSDIISKPLSEGAEQVARLKVFRDWAARSPYTLDECGGCPMIGICGGGCAYDAFIANNGDIHRIDPRVCDCTSEILEFLVWDLFEELRDRVANGIYVPSVDEQASRFRRYYDSGNALQRSVGHEKES